MSSITFKKQRAHYYNNCFTRKIPIEPEDKKAGWTESEMIDLAGYLLGVLTSIYMINEFKKIGVVKTHIISPMEIDFEGQPIPKERVEAITKTAHERYKTAIAHAAHLTERVITTGYDELFKDVIEYDIMRDNEGRNIKVEYIKGRKTPGESGPAKTL